MAISLYDATVASFLQTTSSVATILDRGLAYSKEHSIEPQEVVDTRLIHDMQPFRFQIVSVAHHSIGAIEGVKNGTFSPPPSMHDLDYGALQKIVSDARDALQLLTQAEVNGLEGKEVIFRMGDFKRPYVAEDFLLSFSVPNFYFHATTAYDILRSKGVPIGKRDYLGATRTKP